MSILRSYKKIAMYRDRDRSKLYITPFREWGIVLCIGVVLFLSIIFFSYYAFNNIYIAGFKEDTGERERTDSYNIEELRVELSDVLHYYQKKEIEHDTLLNKQPLFENKIDITKPSEIIDLKDNVGSLDDGINTLSPVGKIPFKHDTTAGIFDRIKTNFSNAASVWTVLFVDLFK